MYLNMLLHIIKYHKIYFNIIVRLNCVSMLTS